MKTIVRCFASIILTIFLTAVTSQFANPAFAATDVWATSLHDVQRTSSSTDTTISPTNVNQLVQKWSFKTGGPIAAAPTVVGNTVYVGSWDGYEYAFDATTGAMLWKTYLGITTADPICIPPMLGISSTATYQSGVLYVGGGDSNWYALNAATGAILWSVPTGDNSATGGHYNWSSPLIYNGYAYIGIASLGDCPLVQGKLLKVDLQTHLIVGETKLVPDGEVGGGMWQSPSLDPTTNRIFLATGTENSPTQTYAQALVAIDATTMKIVDSWKLPESEAVLDSDFSTTAMLFTDANGRKLVAAINKNGDAYTFDRNNVAAGPLWEKNVAIGDDCPTCGATSVSSPTFQQGKAVFAGAGGVINGMTYKGTVRAIDPVTGNYVWQHGATGSVIPALSSANGLVFDAAGSVIEALSAATGERLFSFDTGAGIYSPISIANGMLFTGNLSGKVMAFGLGTPTTPPVDTQCPTDFTCQDIGTPLPAGSETVTNGTWSITAGGAGVTGTTDAFRLMSKSVSADTQVSMQITTAAAKQVGVMLRQDNKANAPYYAAFITPNNGLTIQYRKAYGGGTTVLSNTTISGLPKYIAVQRIGDTLQTATSSDGVTFTVVPGTTTSFAMSSSLMAGIAISSGTQGTGSTATVNNVVISTPTTFAPQPTAHACPQGFTCQDIGNPVLTGDQDLANGVYTVKGAGDDIWGYQDAFHYVSKPITADATLTARVVSQTNTDQWAKAGLMMRLNTSDSAAYYAVFVTPTNGVTVQYRQFSGFNSFQKALTTGTAPQYIQIARYGTTFTAYTSPDGVNWTFVPGSTITLANLSGQILAGMAVTSHNGGTVSTATFDSFSTTNTAPVPPNVCPTGWNCEDIGFPTPDGDQTLVNNVWTIDGGGGDIWNTIDSFRYIYDNLAGDGGISARVISQSNSSDWAKAGVMVRGTADQSAPYYAIFTTPSNGTVIQYRLTQGGGTTQVPAGAAIAPLYVKILRTGTTYAAATSTNGTTWTPVAGSSVSIPSLTGSILAGMAVTSHNTIDASQVKFDSVTLTDSAAVTGCPTNWTCGDIGATGIPGSTTVSNNVYTLKGSGWDIWTTDDMFHYASQPLNGDGTIIARITSQSNTNQWAKAGVMIKESRTDHANYVFMGVTPTNGYRMQYNFTGDVAGGNYTFPNAWVKLTRAGNVFTGYISPNGVNWTQIGTTTQNMNSNATVGLFVTAHDNNALSTATFENVSVTQNTAPSPTPTPNQPTDYTAKFWNIPNNTSVVTVPTTTPDVTRTDTAINFDWGQASPAAGINPDFFVAQWVKTDQFDAADYTFTATSDDGMRVYVDDQIVIDDWTDHSAKTDTATKTMTSGLHTIRVEYYEKWYNAVAKFSYAKATAPITQQPTISHVVYDDQLQNNWVNWSWDSTVDFASTIAPFKGTKNIKWNPTNKYAGLYFHTDSGFNTTGYSALTFAVRATKADEKMEVILFDDQNTVIGKPLPLANYGGDPVVGSYKIYVIPLTDLGGANRVIKGFHLKDISGETTNEIYVDSVGFTSSQQTANTTQSNNLVISGNGNTPDNTTGSSTTNTGGDTSMNTGTSSFSQATVSQ